MIRPYSNFETAEEMCERYKRLGLKWPPPGDSVPFVECDFDDLSFTCLVMSLSEASLRFRVDDWVWLAMFGENDYSETWLNYRTLRNRIGTVVRRFNDLDKSAYGNHYIVRFTIGGREFDYEFKDEELE